MLRKRLMMLMTLAIASLGGRAMAGFQVLDWELSTRLSDSSGELPIFDRSDISAISNPLVTSRTARLGDNISSAAYDHSWITAMAYGDFNTSFSHQIRSPEVRTISTSAIFITATEPVRVSIDGRLDYSHTPGDIDSLNFGVFVRNESTQSRPFFDLTMTGGLYFDPAIGTVLINGEVILEPDVTYQLFYSLDSSNTADHLPTGTLDASGFVNFSIRPVPEPASAVLLCAALSMIRRRGRSS